ncbi:MAG: hypothetical protein U9P79_05995 [Candidatus Cloacimonadota bacterium]|nr:hypothetical protein [Candidatus Cloacimonadota bacterium]
MKNKSEKNSPVLQDWGNRKEEIIYAVHGVTKRSKMKIKLSIPMILILLYASLPATPNWYTGTFANRFSDYFTGKGFAEIKSKNVAEAEKRAEQMALQDAASKITCRISGETIDYISEKGGDEETEVEEYFMSETQVKTDLEIMGCKKLKSEKDDNCIYVLVGIPADDLRNSFKHKIKENIKKVNDEFILAEDLYNSNPKKAMKKYAECVITLQKLSTDMAIYLYLNKWNDDLSQQMGKIPTKYKIEKKLYELTGSVPKTPAELSDDLLAPLLANSKANGSFVIYPVEWQNTGFVSEFGNNFAEILANKIIAETGWQRNAYKYCEDSDYIFRGKILESEQGILILLGMNDLAKGNEKSTQIFVNKLTCENIGWERIKPKDLKKALQNKLALYDAIQTDNRLKIDLQTDKMSDGPLVYYYGDEPKILVRANKSCYIRLMYIFSDETKTLLIDNYHLATDQTNQWIQLPLELEVCEPTGIEQMLVQASTEKQPPVQYEVVKDGGYEFWIIESDIGKQIAKTRGLKRKNPKKEIDEKVYQWTVFE